MTRHQLITDGYGVESNLILEGYTSSHYGMLERILKDMEKKSIGNFCYEAGCVEPGCDGADVPLRKILSRIGR